MIPIFRQLASLLGLVVLLAACDEETAATKPDPVTLTAEAAGHYCQMTVLEHVGPKAQIHLPGNPNPLWFPQVRDAVAFTRLPEEPKDYVAVYVNDMGRAGSWAHPGRDNWIDAETAWFVIDSKKRGGMGAPEAIPFAERADADAFSEKNDGRVVRLADIPDAYVLSPVDASTPGAGTPTRAKEI